MLNRHQQFACLSIVAVAGSTAMPSHAYNLPDAERWDFYTGTDGSFNANQGDPINFTWSILPDGVTTAGRGAGSSELISRFDGIYGGAPSGTNPNDLTQRPWFDIFEDSYNRFNELTGINFSFEPGDPSIAGDDANYAMSSDRDGILGVRGDIRLGAVPLQGELGFAFPPGFGEIVLNNDSFRLSIPNDVSYLVMHETVHALGSGHVVVNDPQTRFLMETTIQPAIFGPQFDDLLGLQRAYGDFHEKSNNGQGNDTRNNATSLGSFSLGPAPGPSQTLSIGTDADGLQIDKEETDFVSIDGLSDIDFFSFTIDNPAEVEIVLTPKGPTYTWAPEFGSERTWDASALNNLDLQLLDTNGDILAESAAAGNGQIESILTSLDGNETYYVRINALGNAIQMYQLDVTATPVPEPSSLVVLAMGGLLVRRRRRI